MVIRELIKKETAENYEFLMGEALDSKARVAWLTA